MHQRIHRQVPEETREYFTRSFDQILVDLVRPPVANKQKTIQFFEAQRQKQVQFSNKEKLNRELQEQNLRDIRRSKNTPTPHDVDERDPFQQFDDDEAQQFIEQPNFHFPMRHHMGDSVSSLTESVDSDFRQLENQINSFKIRKSSKLSELEPIKRTIKKKIIQSSQGIKFQIKERVQLVKNNELKTMEDVFKLMKSDVLNSFNKIKEEKQRLVQVFKMKADEITKKYQKKISKYEEQIEEIQQRYFDYTKANLIRIAIEEGIPKHGSLRYSKTNSKIKAPTQNIQPNQYSEIMSLYKIMFNEKSFSGLQDRCWLHNSVIDNYISYLKVTQNYNTPESKFAIFAFNDSQYILDSWETYRFNSGPIFTKYEKVGMVINLNNDHWFFIGVYTKVNKLVVYDSIPKKSDKYNSYLQKLQNFITREEREFNVPYAVNLTKIDQDTTPKQTNGSDCGIHVLCNLTYFLEDKEDNEFRINFNEQFNNQIRIGMYHFMAYLYYLAKKQINLVKYDWLEYCSRSVLIRNRRQLLWR